MQQQSDLSTEGAIPVVQTYITPQPCFGSERALSPSCLAPQLTYSISAYHQLVTAPRSGQHPYALPQPATSDSVACTFALVPGTEADIFHPHISW